MAQNKTRFPRLVLAKSEGESYKQIEIHTLKVGIWINILMGICGFVGYLFANSYALALDGSLCAVSALSFIIALRITRKRDVTSDEYPFGIYSVENVYAMLQGILLIAITVYAIFEGAGNIVKFVRTSDGGGAEPLHFVPLLVYTIGMVFFCGGVWFYYRAQLKKTRGESPILKSETVSAYMDTFVTIGTGIALILMAKVPADSALSFLNYIGDSMIVIVISLFLLPSPVRLVSRSFFSLIGRTTQNAPLRSRTEKLVRENIGKDFRLQRVLLFHVGSSYEIDVTISPKDDLTFDISRYREVRTRLDAELKKLFPNRVLQLFLE